MGRRRRMKALARSQASATLALAEDNVVPQKTTTAKEIGVSGTAITHGRLYTESNSQLQWEQAYGDGSGLRWGVWERIVRTDSACASALDMVVAPLRDAVLEVEPASDDARDIEIADFVRDNLTEWLEPGWPELVQQIVRGKLTYGFSLHELIWGTRPDKRVPGGRAVFLAKLAQRLPSSIMSDGWIEKDGELAVIRQEGYRDGQWETGIELPAKKCLLVSWNREGNNYAGFSAFRPVYYLTKLRAEMLRIIGVGAQREATGLPVAKESTDAKLTPVQRQELQTLLENIHAHEHAAAVLPPGVDITWIYSPVANKGHVMDTWLRLGEEIHKILQTQQMSLGTSESGSRAVGEVHDKSMTAYVNGVRANLEAALNGVGRRPYAGIVAKLVDPNFGPQAKYPRLKLTTQKADVSLGEMAVAVPAFVNAKLLTPTADDENDIRAKLGMRAIDPEMREAELKRRAAMAPQFQPGPGAFDRARDTGAEPDDEQQEAEDVPRAASASGCVLKLAELKRPLFAWEKHIALQEIDDLHRRAPEQFAEEAGQLLAEALKKAAPQIAEAMKDGDPSEVADLKLDLRKLDRYIASFLEHIRAEGYRHVQREQLKQPADILEDRAAGLVGLSRKGRVLKLEEEDERSAEVERVEEEMDVDLPSIPIKPKQPKDVEARVRKILDAERERLLRRMRARVIDDIEREAIFVIRQGGGDVEEVLARVMDNALSGRGLKQDGGAAVSQAFSVGREQFAQEHQEEVAAVRFSAILDSRTCIPCNLEDGKQFDFNSPEHDAHVPPYKDCRGGERCRCLLVYVWREPGFRRVEEAPEA